MVEPVAGGRRNHSVWDIVPERFRVIRPTASFDRDAILALVESSGQFDADGLAHVTGTLDRYLVGQEDGIWLTAVDDGPVGVAYCAPEPVTSGTWNLLLLWARDDRRGKGHGTALVDQVEAEVRARGARLLIVETSGLPAFDQARAFYLKCGFVHEATIQDFFSAGDAKMIFTKSFAR